MIGARSDPVPAFRAEMEAAGLPTPTEIVPDGQLHRFRVEGDKRGSKNGWYVLYPDEPPAGAFGCWKRGVDVTWCAKAERDFTAEERSAWRRRMAEAKAAREKEERRTRERARKRSRDLWAKATPADPDHPYLVRKSVQPHGIRQLGARLVVPVTHGGQIDGLQFIEADPDAVPAKRFLKGTTKRARYFPIGTPNGQVVIAEGYATAASIHEAADVAAVVAFDAGNLGPVAEAIRDRFPDIEIIIAADNDHETEGNPGLTAAEQAAGLVGARIVAPTFEPGDPGTDWNDVMTTKGTEAVARRFTFEEDPDAEAPNADSGGEALTLTDTGNSSRLVRLHGGRLRFIPPWGKWIVWPEGARRWILDHDDVHVRELAKDVGRELKRQAAEEPDSDRAKKLFSWGLQSLNSGRIGSLVNLARGIEGIPLDHELLDADGWLLGVENGVVDLRTGELRDADPDDLMTRQCPVRYDPTAEAPRWERALEEWFPDPELRAYVQRLAGAALVGIQRDHVFVIHFGHGANGKGTFIRAIENVLGPYAIEAHLSLLVESKYREHDTVRADLFRTRLAVASETERRVRLAEASVKNLTGGDRIRARRMREDPWGFEPTHSLWLLTNHLPEIQGRDAGIWRRIRVVEWVAHFRGAEADTALDEKLAAEAPGVLRWIVEGCLAWQEHGLDEPEAVVRATLAYRHSEDALGRFAEDVGLVFRSGLEIQASELQELLDSWARAEGIDAPRQEVGDWLREQGVRQTRQYYTDSSGNRRRARFWIGVGLEDGKHESEQTHAL
ncbi:MAG: phage/plasmid primase, P4 family [Candidatus Longimicrobiales bacterium M2_2A_002]